MKTFVDQAYLTSLEARVAKGSEERILMRWAVEDMLEALAEDEDISSARLRLYELMERYRDGGEEDGRDAR